MTLSDFFPSCAGQPLAFVHSFGCQQNLSDGERIKGMLIEMGFDLTGDLSQASLVLYNTCAVREGAQDRVFGNVGALKRYKSMRPDMLVGLCGCMTQQEHVAGKIKASFPFVDLVAGTHALDRLPELIMQALEQNRQIFDISDLHERALEGIPVARDSAFKAWVPVMAGCDNFCSYCVVPLVRGRERSRKSRDILEEIKTLAAQGYKEIYLLGQNVNSYGKGLDESIDFAGLLSQINEIEGDFWIRFMTSHPKDLTHRLIDTIANSRRLCNHIHLPVQSGCDRILSAMNRKYNVSDYLALIEYAREKIPGAALTSDIIVGFPGETYEEFRKTAALIEKVRYHCLFTFIYSKREGTAAAAFPDPVPAKEKSVWLNELLEIQRKIGLEIYESYENKTLKVLADGLSRTPGRLTGRTEQNVIVDFEAPDSYIGKFVNVYIEKAHNWMLSGTKL